MQFFLLLNLFALTFLTACNGSSATLKGLFVVHRHGDRKFRSKIDAETESSFNIPNSCSFDSNRNWFKAKSFEIDRIPPWTLTGSPMSIYPNDPYKENFWPEGLSQLTDVGKDRMFQLGGYLRTRYSHFMSDDIKEVKALSSDKDRCIESLLMTVSGAYRSPKSEQCGENILRLFPVHTNPWWSDCVSCISPKFYWFDYVSKHNYVSNSSAKPRLAPVAVTRCWTRIHSVLRQTKRKSRSMQASTSRMWTTRIR